MRIAAFLLKTLGEENNAVLRRGPMRTSPLRAPFRFSVGDPLGAPARTYLRKRRAATWGRPYSVSSTGTVGLVKPGAEVEPHQRQFLQPQGPVARREFRLSLRFCAPELFCLSQGIPPVKWGAGGKRSYGHEVPVGRVPQRSFGYFPIAGKVPRRPQAAKSPHKKEITFSNTPAAGTGEPRPDAEAGCPPSRPGRRWSGPPGGCGRSCGR